MSSDRDAELERILARGVEAFNRGDLDRAYESFAADCRYQVAREHPETRVCVGLEEIQRYQRSWADHMDEIRWEVDEVNVIAVEEFRDHEQDRRRLRQLG